MTESLQNLCRKHYYYYPLAVLDYYPPWRVPITTPALTNFLQKALEILAESRTCFPFLGGGARGILPIPPSAGSLIFLQRCERNKSAHLSIILSTTSHSVDTYNSIQHLIRSAPGPTNIQLNKHFYNCV